MKTNNVDSRQIIVGVILFFVLTILSGSCNYETVVQPQSPMSLKLGYLGLVSDGSWTFLPFSDQQKISFDSLQSRTQSGIAKGLMLRMSEYGVNCKTINYRSGSDNGAEVMNSLVFVFQAGSSEDKEIFVTGKNGWAEGRGLGVDDNYVDCVLDLNYLMPVKLVRSYPSLRMSVHNNNDTLEINAVDTIRISYRSPYSSRVISTNLIVK